MIGKSYATFGFTRSWRQIRHAWRERKLAERNMSLVLDGVRRHEAHMASKLGQPIQGLHMLEVGPGQGMERARYFSLANEVVGMDLDVIPQGIAPGAYMQMLRENGAGRFVKTVGRKLIVGGPNAKAWAKAVGSGEMRAPRLMAGDICEAPPERNAYDVVMSWSVFEHLPDPAAALKNIIDALRPGGIFYISLHLYTAHNGHHDIRAFTGDAEALPLWGHLRPATQHLIEPSSYLNEWRLAEWRDLFSSLVPCPDEFLQTGEEEAKLWKQVTTEIRAELGGYSDEELLTVDVIYLWQKPHGERSSGFSATEGSRVKGAMNTNQRETDE